MAFTQANRSLLLSTPLGDDVLLVQSFGMSEKVSGLFTLNLEMIADEASASSISPEAILGKPVSLRVALPSGSRHFHAIVTQFEEGESTERFRSFKAEASPWFWLLTLTSDCRIFQDKTVPTIIEDVFREMGFNDFRNVLTRTYQTRDYCVQYRETDFDFVSRLMEEEGIFYFFEHEAGKHTMVLADSPSAFTTSDAQPVARYDAEIGMAEWEDVITSWQRVQSLRPGKYTLRDFHFQIPAKRNEATVAARDPFPGTDNLELFDYPGGYAKPFNKRDPGGIDRDAGDTAKLRMQEEESTQTQFAGNSYCRGLSAGERFRLDGHPNMSGDYVITAIQHTGVQSPAYVSDIAVEPFYSNTMTCIPYGHDFRPPRTTERALVAGLQTGIVVGPAGEEIWTDKYGRIKVQFHWDRRGKKDENSSCWMRVAQPWAGNRWGIQFIPRIGHEVVIDFLEGDPDHPLVIGSLYNHEQMPPFELPGKQTQSGLRTRSTKGGGSANFNELRFDDTKGNEDIYFHAEKDFRRLVENNDDLKVGNDQTIEISNNRTERVVKGDEKITIEKGERIVTVATGNDVKKVQKGDRKAVIDMGNDSLQIKMGNQTTKLDLGKSETEAMQSIELKVGASSVLLDQKGVTIKGMMIKIDGSIQVDVQGLMTSVKGNAMLTLKGGLTMIN